MLVKTGRFGKFLACSNYPKCKNTKKILVNGEGKLEVAQEEITSETCEQCGASMVIKTGRFGKFLACSKYPKCKTTKRIGAAGGEKGEKAKAEPTGDNCEKCGAALVYRKGRFGPFIACSNYPKCRFTEKLSKSKEAEGSGEGPPSSDQPPPVRKAVRKKKAPL
jgi:DNA topoisomerase-1